MSQFIEMFGDFHNKVQIKDICLVVSGKSIPTKLEDIDGNNPYIKVADFNIPGNEKYITIAQRYVSDDSASYSKQIPEGSVIFAKNGAASMSNKKRLTKIRCCIDMNTMAVFPKNESILSDFLFATIEAMDVSSHVRQGAIPSISPKSIEDSYIAMPTMEEQYRYVSIAKHADKSGFDGFKSQFIEMFTDKGYPLTMIKSFADVSTGGTPSKAHPEYWNGDKPWVSAEDMKSKYVYDTCEKVTVAGYATCKIVPVDTLMYVCRGSIGVMAINKIECATNQSICRATCHNNVCNVEFLYHALMYQRDNIKKKGTGTSFKSLNQTTFSELEIGLPPYDEQMKFVTIAEQADKSGSVLQHMIAC